MHAFGTLDTYPQVSLNGSLTLTKEAITLTSCVVKDKPALILYAGLCIAFSLFAPGTPSLFAATVKKRAFVLRVCVCTYITR